LKVLRPFSDPDPSRCKMDSTIDKLAEIIAKQALEIRSLKLDLELRDARIANLQGQILLAETRVFTRTLECTALRELADTAKEAYVELTDKISVLGSRPRV